MVVANDDLSGRVAIVTGGGRGVGQAISVGLAECGADVALTYNRDVDTAEQTVKQIEALGRKAKHYQAGVQSREDVEALVNNVVSDFGGIDILVNNAGIASRGKTVADTDPDELERVIRVHALGPHYLCSLVLPHMRKRDRGDIVMISSIATLKMSANGAPYNMGKAAMEALTQTLAREERANNIHASVVRPGLVETEMGNRLAIATRNVEHIKDLASKSPFNRVCQPKDVADAVVFLVSSRGSYLSGQTIEVSGGQEWF